MKKLMVAALCMVMATMGCMAKNNGHNNGNNEHSPKVVMNDHNRNESHKGINSDQIIDMNAIHRMDLSWNQMKKVEKLKERCDKEMKKLYAKHNEKQIRKAAEKYDKELEKILGHENYRRYEYLTGNNLAMNNHRDNGQKPDNNSNVIISHGRR